jgi:hypothetical protein
MMADVSQSPAVAQAAAASASVSPQGPIGNQGPPAIPEGMAPARPALVEVPEPERATHSYIVESRRGPDVAVLRAAARRAHTSSNLIVAMALVGVVTVAGVLTVALV